MSLSQDSHLKELENEAIHIIREVAASFRKPVVLYSVGKDSSVMLWLMKKAFYPSKIPFPLMHIDTGYKYPEMYEFRDQTIKDLGVELLVEGVEAGDKPEVHPSEVGMDRCCALLKTGALLKAIQKHGFDAAFGGARRDEEKSRAKERIFSIRDSFGQWNPKDQRPELWKQFNTKLAENQSMRVFPLSNWTEKDIWQYIKQEEIPVVPLYFAKKRKVIPQGNVWIPVEHQEVAFRRDIAPSEIQEVSCRYRSLGCIPCTGAVASEAGTLDEVIEEIFSAKRSERENRLIDQTGDASMEQKKKEGYF